MAFEIEWSDNAIQDFNRVVDYLQVKWSVSTADRFITNLDAQLENLSHFPLIGISSKKDESARYIVITKHNKLYYRIKDSKIYILNIFDTRQDPAKNRFE